MDYDAIVIGCGHNGMVAAYYLADAGLKVLALERNDKVGGMASTDELIPGYQFTTYGHSFTMFHTKIMDDMRLLERGLHMDVKDPGYFHPFPSGKELTLWGDFEKTLDSIAAISPRDAEAWPDWLATNARMGAMFEPYLLTEPPSLGELARKFEGTEDEEIFYRLLTGSVRGFVDDFFESEELKASVIATFDSGTTDAPGALLYWAFHTATSAGLGARGLSGYPRGGMGAVAKVIGEATEEAGVEIKTNAGVESVIVRDGRSVGVRLSDGTEISARVVISNVDPQRTLLGLVGRDELDPDFAERLDRVRGVAGYFKLHCACSGLPEWTASPGAGPLPIHYAQTHICNSLDIYDEAWIEARHGRIPRRFSLAMISTTVHDPTTAPPGKFCISIWGEFAPMRLAEGSWDDMAAVAAQNMIDQVAEHAPNFPDLVDDWSLVTPESIAERYGLTHGHMHH
ncbi:MAG: NAD(P)/FAD-dependent oxidoreductase, partial [Chloroflexota bacterium]|nr:NAD(P)/FAD-dependent oxidoreductase [Chloroflexota bacterium]